MKEASTPPTEKIIADAALKQLQKMTPEQRNQWARMALLPIEVVENCLAEYKQRLREKRFGVKLSPVERAQLELVLKLGALVQNSPAGIQDVLFDVLTAEISYKPKNIHPTFRTKEVPTAQSVFI